MPLPTCECVTGMPIGEQLGFIYCALTQILANGGGGGTVNIEDVEGVSDFWKATLGGTPAANQVFGTDGAGVFTTFDISDVGINVLALATPPAQRLLQVSDDNTIAYVDATEVAVFISEGASGVSGTQNPVTEITTVNGIITAIS